MNKEKILGQLAPAKDSINLLSGNEKYYESILIYHPQRK